MEAAAGRTDKQFALGSLPEGYGMLVGVCGGEAGAGRGGRDPFSRTLLSGGGVCCMHPYHFTHRRAPHTHNPAIVISIESAPTLACATAAAVASGHRRDSTSRGRQRVMACAPPCQHTLNAADLMPAN